MEWDKMWYAYHITVKLPTHTHNMAFHLDYCVCVSVLPAIIFWMWDVLLAKYASVVYYPSNLIKLSHAIETIVCESRENKFKLIVYCTCIVVHTRTRNDIVYTQISWFASTSTSTLLSSSSRNKMLSSSIYLYMLAWMYVAFIRAKLQSNEETVKWHKCRTESVPFSTRTHMYTQQASWRKPSQAVGKSTHKFEFRTTTTRWFQMPVPAHSLDRTFHMKMG